MKPAAVHYDSLIVDLGIGPDIRDITLELETIVTQSRIVNGVLYATVVGSTGSITTIEYEPGVVKDLKDAIERMAPRGMEYEHEKAWHDGNGHSHVQAALMGPSIAVAVRNGRLRLGTWQQVVAINHDNRARRRPIEITVTGTIDKRGS
jgi:secondary thiamine-phosphate synthase enzyme